MVAVAGGPSGCAITAAPLQVSIRVEITPPWITPLRGSELWQVAVLEMWMQQHGV